MRDAAMPVAYIYDANTITYQYATLRQALPRQVEVFYAMKANPALAIVRLLTALGASVDIASFGELWACKKIGVAPERIAYTAPIKPGNTLKEIIRFAPYINIESLHEAELLSQAATELHKTIDVGLRINPTFHIQSAHLALSEGASSKFGLDIERVPEIYAQIARLPGLNVNGIHTSVASGVLSAKELLAYYEHCFQFTRQLSAYFEIERIDMGGGLGIPYHAQEYPLDVAQLGQGLKRIIAQFPDLAKMRIILEPGRYLVGSAGIYASTVDHLKTSRDRELLMVHGGIHHYARPALIGKANPTMNLSRRGPLRTYAVADETATSVGYFGKNLRLAAARPGDFIGIFNAGSYGLTQSATGFISHGTPPEILVLDGESHTIREAKPAEAHLEGQYISRPLKKTLSSQ